MKVNGNPCMLHDVGQSLTMKDAMSTTDPPMIKGYWDVITVNMSACKVKNKGEVFVEIIIKDSIVLQNVDAINDEYVSDCTV